MRGQCAPLTFGVVHIVHITSVLTPTERLSDFLSCGSPRALSELLTEGAINSRNISTARFELGTELGTMVPQPALHNGFVRAYKRQKMKRFRPYYGLSISDEEKGCGYCGTI
jgi:hypothetical protein